MADTGQNQPQTYRRYRASPERELIYRRDAGVCGICLTTVDPATFVLDHIIPVIRGGSDDSANLQPAHFLCNQRKSTKAPGDQLTLAIPFTRDETRQRWQRRTAVIQELLARGVNPWQALKSMPRDWFVPGERQLEQLERLALEHLDCKGAKR